MVSLVETLKPGPKDDPYGMKLTYQNFLVIHDGLRETGLLGWLFFYTSAHLPRVVPPGGSQRSPCLQALGNGGGKGPDVDIFSRPLLTAEAALASEISEFSEDDEDPERKLSETRWTQLS